MKLKIWLRLMVIAILVVVAVNLVRSCQADPAQLQLFDRLAMMRNDMQAIIDGGGRVVRYDNNGKATIARVYLLLSIDRQTWTVDLQRIYGNTLLARGWVRVRRGSELSFCKNGALASVTAPIADSNGSIAMTFDAASISKCRKLISTSEAR